MTEALARNGDFDTRLLLDNKCDKFDYLTSVACGAIAGIIDILYVGTAKNGKLTKWTDKMTDEAIMKFAKSSFVKKVTSSKGWCPKSGNENNVASAIGFLERNFAVNYDQRHTADVGGAFDMSTKNHHIKSLGHAPDIVGLFFSILNQFTGTASFFSDGEIKTIKTENFELKGETFSQKLFCGFANWIGHLMSDIGGSSGGRGNGGRGSGIAIPFYELLQKCNIGSFQIGKARQDLATLAVRAYQDGYDYRHGLAMTIPVFMCNTLIDFIWMIKCRFYLKKSLKECNPTLRHNDLALMRLFGNVTLCVFDGGDALIKCGGNLLLFFSGLNIIAWFNLGRLVLKKICIDMKIYTPIAQIEAYRMINEALEEKLRELERIDLDAYKKETAKYKDFTEALVKANTEKEFGRILKKSNTMLGVKSPWTGSFDKFMGNKSNQMEFKN